MNHATWSAAALAGCVSFMTSSAFAAEPKQGWMFRGDLSLQQGVQSWNVSTEQDDWSSSSVDLGGRIDMNVGYAPTRLLRLGLALGADFGSAYVQDDGIPNTELGGWQRWAIGPRVGFRFGPRAPLELEVGLSYAQMRQLGSQAFPADGNDRGPGGYDLADILHGTVGSALLLWRPTGADSMWALHAGLTGGWGYATVGDGTQVAGFVSSLVVGVSIGK